MATIWKVLIGIIAMPFIYIIVKSMFIEPIKKFGLIKGVFIGLSPIIIILGLAYMYSAGGWILEYFTKSENPILVFLVSNLLGLLIMFVCSLIVGIWQYFKK